MTFEFDPRKSEANARKHGIDFETARALWDDPGLLIAPARSVDEPRFLAIGNIGGKLWSAIVTHRGGGDPAHLGSKGSGRGDRAL